MTAPVLRLGTWQRALKDQTCDAWISDPPYSAKTHEGHNRARSADGSARRTLDYGHLTPAQVAAIVASWSPRTRGWMVALCDDVLSPVWARAFEKAGRFVFAGLPIVWPGMTVRQQGDGPSREAIWFVAARPRNNTFARWGTLRGFYTAARDSWSEQQGGKPLALMEALVRDYSRPGDVVVDPFGGQGTTLLAAARMGRIGIGAEVDPENHARGVAALAKAWTPDLFEAFAASGRRTKPPVPPDMFGGDEPSP